MIHEHEARCSEETAMKMMKDDDSRVSYNPTFGAALGIPLVVSEDVPEGKVQFWLDGKFVKEVGIEL